MLTSITPLAIDAYLPSFSQMADSFYTSIDEIEITLGIYLIGFALGQLLGGPLSDRYGRKPFIYGGLVIYIIFSISIAFAESIQMLWIFRFFQAVGGGFAVVNTNAIVRDIFKGREGARVFSLIAMIMMVAPMFAPAIGTVILKVWNWSAIFIFLGIYASLLLYFISILPETSKKIRERSLFSNYIRIVKDSRALLIILSNSFAISGMFVFITKASFIYIEYFQSGYDYFILYFGLNVVGVMGISRLNLTLLKNYSQIKLFKFGLYFQFVIGLLLYFVGSNNGVEVVVPLIVLYIGALGFVFGNAISLVLEDFGDISATANALNGVVGFIIAGVIGVFISSFHDGTLSPIFLTITLTSLVSIIFLTIFSFKKSL
jgi:DHA1 family bicyclomycin/chloramphenicol resistance-like MFS transporter